LAGLAAHHIVEEEELHNDLAEVQEVRRNVVEAADEEEGRHSGLVEVREVRRNAEEEEVAADSHHRAVEVEEDHQEEDNGLEVADTHLAEEDTVLEEVADTRRRAAEVGDIDHNLAAAAAVGRREHRNLGKTWRLVLLCLCNVM
jgi:hypothetical protein